VLLLLAGFLMTRLSVERRVDWRAARGEAVLLGAAALVPIAASSHAAAVEPSTALAIAVDGFHLLATGVWAGGLLPLALLLRAAGREEGADARPYAVLVAHRFSGCALAAVLALVLSGAPPARHEPPEWPFSFRLSLVALEGAPDAATRALVGSQLAVLGLVGVVAALVRHVWRLRLLAGGIIVLAAGAGLALPPLALDAYPTTYLRPAVPYQATAIAMGAALYQTNCAVCHGTTGAGDGPGGGRLLRRPADLRAPHTAQHTAGDLFWWITHGIPLAAMPAFGDRVSEEERWDLVNFLRALSSAHAARSLGPVVEPERSWLVAPAFTFAVGPTPPRALNAYRAPHAELVTDRQGDSRSITRESREAAAMSALLAEIQQLNEEKTTTPAPEEHVH